MRLKNCSYLLFCSLLLTSCSSKPNSNEVSDSVLKILNNDSIKISIDSLNLIQEYDYLLFLNKVGKCYKYSGQVTAVALVDIRRANEKINSELMTAEAFQKRLDDKKKYYYDHRDCRGNIGCESSVGPRDQEEIDKDYFPFEKHSKNEFPITNKKGDILGKNIQIEFSACKNDVSKEKLLAFPGGISWIQK